VTSVPAQARCAALLAILLVNAETSVAHTAPEGAITVDANVIPEATNRMLVGVRVEASRRWSSTAASNGLTGSAEECSS
jgi:hypothetical protein